MSVKASISISDQQQEFARRMVDDGRFSSLSAVVQHGLELVRQETEMREAELSALRGLLERRYGGAFISQEEGRERTRKMIEEKRVKYGL